MFESVAPGYDRMNRLLSLGMDRGWRRAAIRELAPGPDSLTLDLCCGTGDLLFALPKGSRTVGCDFTPAMLDLAREKAEAAQERHPLVAGDALRLPFRSGSFDRVVVGFGVRNLPDPEKALREMRRVLGPGGRVVILEFSQPKGRLVRWGHRLWLRIGLPLIARLASPGPEAYGYLRDSVIEFREPEAIAAQLRDSGFAEVSWRTLWFGTVAVHAARTPDGITGAPRESRRDTAAVRSSGHR